MCAYVSKIYCHPRNRNCAANCQKVISRCYGILLWVHNLTESLSSAIVSYNIKTYLEWLANCCPGTCCQPCPFDKYTCDIKSYSFRIR